MIRIISNIEDKKYEMLIDYLATKCDTISFYVRNYYQRYITEKNASQSDYAKGVVGKNEIDSEEFIRFKKGLKHVMKPFEPFIIREYDDVEYLGTICHQKLEVKIIKFDKSLVKELKKANGLYEWRAPNRPEDLSFYINGKCFLESVGHENYCFIYANDKETMSILDKIGFKYWIEPDKNDLIAQK